MRTLQDHRPSGLAGKAKHTITIEPQPSGARAIVERYGVGFSRVLIRDVDLTPGVTVEQAARLCAAATGAKFIDVTPAASYTAPRELPVDVVDVGDQVALANEDGEQHWVTVTWVDDCRGEFCPQVAGVCAGVLGLADGAERHYDVVDRPTVRIPCEVTA